MKVLPSASWLPSLASTFVLPLVTALLRMIIILTSKLHFSISWCRSESCLELYTFVVNTVRILTISLSNQLWAVSIILAFIDLDFSYFLITWITSLYILAWYATYIKTSAFSIIIKNYDFVTTVYLLHKKKLCWQHLFVVSKHPLSLQSQLLFWSLNTRK